MAAIRIGISGWRYASWRGDFYPRGLAQKDELRFASQALDSIEINGSFYALQTPARYARWYAQTPAGFLFSVKAPRFITHMRKLRDPEKPLANFFASGLFCLREKLGPIIWQLPPTLRFDPALIADFLARLPHDTEAALTLAREHEARMAGRCQLAIDRRRPLRHALEVRHESFLDPAFVELLRQHRVALVIADTAGRWPRCEDITSDFLYLRLHGAEELYASGYSDAELELWSRRIHLWSQGGQPPDACLISPRQPRRRRSRDIYCYFDNDARGCAPHDACRLRARLGLTRPGLAQPSDLTRSLQTIPGELPEEAPGAAA